MKWQATLAQHNVALLDAQQPRENARKGGVDYLAPTQKPRWLEPHQTHVTTDPRDKHYANDVTTTVQPIISTWTQEMPGLSLSSMARKCFNQI